MTQAQMMNYTIKTDSEELRDKILDWIEKNNDPPWDVRIDAWSSDDDDEGKWGLFVDGGTVSMKRKLLSAFKGLPLSIDESTDSYNL
jgi:hypothetical protein